MKFIIKKIKHIKKFILFFNMSYFNFLNKQRVFLRKNFGNVFLKTNYGKNR